MKIHVISLIMLLSIFFSACTEENQGDANETSQSEGSSAVSEATPLSEQQVHSLTEKGKFIALATFAKLSNSLMGAMKEDGVRSAVTYCNLSAYPLTDSLSNEMNARIRRTSLKYRNPRNAPSKEEKEVIEAFEKLHAESQPMNPVLKASGQDSVTFYGPMIVMDLCLNCHGVAGETLSPDAPELLSSLYPEDKATGYKVGDLRGVWSIRMAK